MDQQVRDSGFTLIEIMIAIAIFAVFVVVYISGQGTNVLDSIALRENAILQRLAQNKMNEIIVEPPEFRESLTSRRDVKEFEDYPGYSYFIDMKRLELPTFEGMTGEETQDQEQQSNNAIQKRIYNQVRDNFERILWQVEVVVSNKETERSYSLATWIIDRDAQVRFNY